MPSPVSRERGFYYANPQNRFWRVLAAVFGEAFPESIEARTSLVLRHHIALWDVLASCETEGASDSRITKPVCNDFSPLLAAAKIRRVYTTGVKAHALYTRHCLALTAIPAVPLPSASPANCRCSFDELVRRYSVLRPRLYTQRQCL
jgi:hypoxanthine-DNA glycosylase